MGWRLFKRSCLLRCTFMSRICFGVNAVTLSPSVRSRVQTKHSGVVTNWIVIPKERFKKSEYAKELGRCETIMASPRHTISRQQTSARRHSLLFLFRRCRSHVLHTTLADAFRTSGSVYVVLSCHFMKDATNLTPSTSPHRMWLKNGTQCLRNLQTAPDIVTCYGLGGSGIEYRW